jgi:hypothetical protein
VTLYLLDYPLLFLLCASATKHFMKGFECHGKHSRRWRIGPDFNLPVLDAGSS